MSHLFYPEKYRFINSSNMPGFVVAMIFIFILGFILRYQVPTKKMYYRVMGGMFMVWVICEITCYTIFTIDKLELFAIAIPCVQLAFPSFCIFWGSLILHILCCIFHKRPLK